MQAAHIVLIEDNLADVQLVTRALNEHGIAYSLTRFESGEEAVRALCGGPADGGAAPNAILLDLNTPRSDGFEVLRSFKQSPRLAGVPIAILTSSRAPRDKHRAAIQGARYIEKPSHLADFLSTVGQAVREMLVGASGSGRSGRFPEGTASIGSDHRGL